MRIVHISDCYAPRTGGMETQVRALASEQVKAGHRVTVLTATPGATQNNLDDGIEVVRITVRAPGDLPIHPRTRVHVSAVVTEIAPDVVHLHVGEISPFAWGGMRAVCRMGLPRVITVHSVWSPMFRQVLAPLGRGWAQPPTVMSAVSAMAAARVGSALEVKVHLLPNGIDTETWSPRPPLPHDGVQFVAVQRLAPRKRTGALVRAFSAASGGAPDMRLVIVGDGPARRSLERRVAAWGRGDSITFLGRVAPDVIREVFRSSDAFVQASRRESFGIAALEARASGIPVIAFRASGTADFITDGADGILVDDDADLSRAIGSVGRDRALRSRITAHARSAPVAQTWNHIIPAVDDLYRQARSAVRLPQ